MMAVDPRAALTVLPPPSGAVVTRDLLYRTEGERRLHLDVYRPAGDDAPRPAVFLVSGDATEEVIAHAKDWGVFRSYGEHLAARGLVGVAFDHRSSERFTRTADVAADVAAAIAFVRSRSEELGVDPERVGAWVFSAGGPFGIAPLLRERPPWLRCLAGFYTVWDLRPFLPDEGRGPAFARSGAGCYGSGCRGTAARTDWRLGPDARGKPPYPFGGEAHDHGSDPGADRDGERAGGICHSPE